MHAAEKGVVTFLVLFITLSLLSRVVDISVAQVLWFSIGGMLGATAAAKLIPWLRRFDRPDTVDDAAMRRLARALGKMEAHRNFTHE